MRHQSIRFQLTGIGLFFPLLLAAALATLARLEAQPFSPGGDKVAIDPLLAKYSHKKFWSDELGRELCATRHPQYAGDGPGQLYLRGLILQFKPEYPQSTGRPDLSFLALGPGGKRRGGLAFTSGPYSAFVNLSLPVEPSLLRALAQRSELSSVKPFCVVNTHFRIQLRSDAVVNSDEPCYAEQWGHLAMHFDAEIARRSSSVTVGVFDTGIQYRHVEFGFACHEASGSACCQDCGADFFYQYESSQRQPMIGGEHCLDDLCEPHGTQMSGIIAAKPNGLGIIGLAPQAKLVSLAVGNRNDGKANERDERGFLAAIKFAEKTGVQVLNFSFAVNFATEISVARVCHALADYGAGKSARGIVVIANSDGAPTSCANQIGGQALLTNHYWLNADNSLEVVVADQVIDLYGPGSHMITTTSSRPDSVSSLAKLGGSFSPSAAAAHVSGAAAQVWGQVPFKKCDAPQIARLLIKTARVVEVKKTYIRLVDVGFLRQMQVEKKLDFDFGDCEKAIEAAVGAAKTWHATSKPDGGFVSMPN